MKMYDIQKNTTIQSYMNHLIEHLGMQKYLAPEASEFSKV